MFLLSTCTYQSHAFGWRTQSPTSASSSDAVQTNSQHTSHHVQAPTYIPWHSSTPGTLKGYSHTVSPITYLESNNASPTHQVWRWIGIHKIWRTVHTYILYVNIINTHMHIQCMCVLYILHLRMYVCTYVHNCTDWSRCMHIFMPIIGSVSRLCRTYMTWRCKPYLWLNWAWNGDFPWATQQLKGHWHVWIIFDML